jgi:hypothetical protein
MVRNRAILAVLAMVAAGWTWQAQAADGSGASKGTRQVVFSFDSWSLGSYNGGVGIRYFVTGDVAIRPGVDFRIEDSSDDETSEAEGRLMTDSIDVDGLTLGFSVFVEKYVSGFQKLAPFVGVGLGYAYTSSDNMQIHYTYRDNPPNSYWSDCYDRTTHAIDIMGTLGFQWFFTDHISLGGQYNLAVSHKWDDRAQTQTSYDGYATEVSATRSDIENTVVGVDAGRLLVSIRF